MSSNLGIILSSIFVVFFVLLGGDMICLSNAYSSLDNASITIGYLISKNARADIEYLSYLSNQYNVNFSYISSTSPQPGDVVDFTIYRYYSPLFLSNNNMEIVANRSTVIGYFG